ncbi:uncharacterized protein J8A68_000861 [[Candida] subhashii]|uniref:Uncharacterized protein n=1 Tax=[Candida] subhashii TaxID=561895 RepID=A0A8J5QU16_9ASCO|nr:uncharacterized protein J8A68_000861 [[Candida] subhashii]KAG7665655.1 hypothetical protein J8A68_000861 [[Candida] subhashii]
MNNIEVRKCRRCKKQRSDDEPVEARQFKTCPSCRLHESQRNKETRKQIRERLHSGLRLCTRCGKDRPDDEAEETRKFKNCLTCRLYQHQREKEIQRQIREGFGSGVRSCTRCRKSRPDDEAEETRKFKQCSSCRVQDSQRGKRRNRKIQERFNRGLRICTGCGKDRPYDEPEASRKFKCCSTCRLRRQRYKETRKKTLNRVALACPTAVELPSVDKQLSIELGGQDATSGSPPVQSPGRIAHNQKFTIHSPGTDNEQTCPRSLEAGEIALQQEIEDIQPQYATLERNLITRASREPNNLSAYHCIQSEVETISSGKAEDSEISEETEMINPSSSDFLETLKPDPELQSEYRKYLANDDLMGFSERYISDTMDKYDICRMIVALGYPKESIKDYIHLTVTETLEVLIDLIREDFFQESDV